MERSRKRLSLTVILGILSVVMGFAFFAQGVSFAKTAQAADDAAALTIDGVTTNYSRLDDLMNDIPDTSTTENTTVTMLNDVYFYSVNDKSFTLDLNGKKPYTNGNQAPRNVTMVVIDSAGGGELQFSGSQFLNCNITLKAGTLRNYINVINHSFDGGSVTVDGGTVTAPTVVNNGCVYTVKSGSVSELLLNYAIGKGTFSLTGGKVELLKINNQSKFLFGGSVGKLELADGSALTSASYKNFLADNKAYAKEGTTELIKLADMPTYSGAVSIVDHTSHGSFVGACDYCGFECDHAELDDDFRCVKCNTLLPEYEAIKIVRNNLVKAKTDLLADVTNNRNNIASINSKVTALDAAIAAANNAIAGLETADTTLKGEIDAARSEVNSAVSAAIEAAKNELLADINSNTNDINAFRTRIEALESSLAAANAVIEGLKNEDTALKNEIATARSEVNSAVSAAIEAAKNELLADINSNTNDINAFRTRIEALESSLAAANAVIEGLKNEDTALKNEITTARSEVNSAVRTAINEAKAELEIAISEKADTATVNAKIAELNAAIENAKLASNAYADEKDLALKQELSEAISAAKTDAISASNTAIANAKAELETAISAKADTATVNAKIAELNAAIENAKLASNAYADEKDLALKQELLEAISAAKNDAIAASNTAIANAKAELETAISAKADTATVNAKIAELNAAIENAKLASNAYADEKDLALKQELSEAISTAKTDAIAASNKVITDAKVKLRTAINAKADAKTVEEAIKTLNTAILNAETACKDYADEKNALLKGELEIEIKNAKTELTAAINDLAKRLEAAEKNINANSESISSLKTLVIVFCAVLLAIDVITVVLFFVLKRKKENQSSKN